MNGERAKAAKVLRVGDAVEVRRAPYTYAILVKGLSDRRGPATEAQALYAETPESTARRAQLAAELKSFTPPRFPGRPTKKDRRDYERWFRGNPEDD